MGTIVVHDSESVEPTIFQGWESRHLISPEREENSTWLEAILVRLGS